MVCGWLAIAFDLICFLGGALPPLVLLCLVLRSCFGCSVAIDFLFMSAVVSSIVPVRNRLVIPQWRLQIFSGVTCLGKPRFLYYSTSEQIIAGANGWKCKCEL